MKKLQVWEASTNSDLTEGKGAKVHLGYFTHQVHAVQAARGRGVFGTDGYVESVELVIFEQMGEFTAYDRARDPDYQRYLELKERFG